MSSDIVEKFQVDELTVEIIRDDLADSPDEWGNTDAFIVGSHRDFTVKRKGFGPDDVEEVEESYHCFPIDIYSHSGVSLRLSSDKPSQHREWDTTYGGAMAFIQKNEDWPDTAEGREKARRVAKGLVETWNEYLSGDVYEFLIKNEDGEILDSCGGFYGLDYAISDAKAHAECFAKEERQKKFNKLKAYIKNRVPLEKRVL